MKSFQVRVPTVAAAVVWAVCVAAVRGYDISFDVLANKRVLVVGGYGRVGGSVVTQLVRHQSQVTVGGTQKYNFDAACERWRRVQQSADLEHRFTKNVKFEQMDRESVDSVSRVLRENSFDLVIHTAGPFQGKAQTPNGVLQACVENSIPYLDVCDDYCTAMAAKSNFASKATAPCIVSTGCWPGVSSLRAKQLIRSTLDAVPDLTSADLSVDFAFFTAG